jgi:hypothetical protein
MIACNALGSVLLDNGGGVTGTKGTIADISLQITAAKRAGGCGSGGGGNQCGISWPGARKPGCRRRPDVEDAHSADLLV